MSGNRIDVVLVKLCAVVIVVLSLQSLTGYVGYFFVAEGAYPQAVLAFLFIFVIPAVLAALLWFYPATTIGLSNAESAVPSTPRPEPLVLVGVTLIGLYALVFGAIDLFYYEAVRAAEAAYSGGDAYGTFRPSPDTVAGRYTNIFQVIIGVSLLLGRRGLAKLFSAVRYSGAGAS